ncbi:MAG: Maf family nucleotide pyrophosphatase [Robiginitomaculum sp.]|nr:Maf family nucleotide pyrophosphatase [Robiginitomaculum sp.]
MSGAKIPHLILASTSPRRRELLARIGVVPNDIIPADIDEDPRKDELPKPHALRLAIGKAQEIAPAHKGSYILSADTVVGVGRRILPKAEDAETAKACLDLLSGRAHRVFTGVCLITPDGREISRVVETRLKMKRLSGVEMTTYLESGEWDGKAGGYGIQGLAGAFIAHISGSYSNVVGLPVYETRNMLIGAGYING